MCPQDSLVLLDSSRPEAAHTGAFFKSFGVFADTESSSTRTGSSSQIFGFETGIDRAIGEDWIVGFSFGYADTHTDLAAGLGDLEDDTYRFGPYAGWSTGNWFAEGGLTFGIHDQSSTRNDSTGTSRGSADAYRPDGLRARRVRPHARPPPRGHPDAGRPLLVLRA